MPRKKKTEQTVNRTANPNVMGLHAAVEEQRIATTLKENYMPYAMSVIVSRAIPEIDGFKPSHRKLLYTMYKMGLLTQPRTKSANIVGQTMRLNPHGDAAIYDTMVRLSKGYGALLQPFVDSKGNFGKVYSRDMAWAASRYTEAKLSPICQELFKDLDQDAVDFVDNYDNTMKEPSLLPTTYPNILVSANQGIAVGMASNLCGFNLTEVCDATIAYLKNPKCDLSSILLGPDFPTGGEYVCNPASLNEVYNTGRGSLKIRGKYRYDKKQNVIEIYEIPYTTTSEAIIDKVGELIKTNKIRDINDMRDETDLNGLKLAIDLKRGVDPDKLMATLFKTTSLQDNFGCNFNVLIDGMPKVLGVRDLLGEWCEWRIGCIRRRTTYSIGKKQDKLHLLLGLQSILVDIDKAIRIIRNTEKEADVVPNLMSGFHIDEIQAEYVAEIKLRNINREYILKRTKEIDSLKKEIEDLTSLAGSERRIQNVIVKELNEVKKKYGEPRKTTIVYEHEIETFEEDTAVPTYPVTVFLTKEGYFKKITPQSLRMADTQKLKEGDAIRQSYETDNSAEVMFFTDRAQVYKSSVSAFDDTKASAMGDFLSAKLGMDDGESVVGMVLPGDYSGYLVFAFKNGKVAKVELSAYITASKRRRLTGAYSDKSKLIGFCYITEDKEFVVQSDANRALIFHTALIAPKSTRSAQGNQIMTLKPKNKVVSFTPLDSMKIARETRYRCRSVPATGQIFRSEDYEQISLISESEDEK